MVTSRILFTARQKAELWERWKNGQSVLAISRAQERRNKTGVQRIVAVQKSSLDDLVGEREHVRRDGDADGVGRLEVDH
jgi:hypothetical protein